MNRRDKGKERKNMPCVEREVIAVVVVHHGQLRQTISLAPVVKEGLGLGSQVGDRIPFEIWLIVLCQLSCESGRDVQDI